MKILILTAAIGLSLSACGNKEDIQEDPSINAWHGEGVLRKIDRAGTEKVTPTLLDCRVITEARNVHYYYRVFGETSTAQQKDASTVEIKNVEVHIDRVIINSFEGGRSGSTSMEGIFWESANLVIRKGEFTEYSLVANQETENRARYFHLRNPYFNDIKVNETFFRAVRSNDGPKTIAYEGLDMPGLYHGKKLECRIIAL